MVACGKLVWEGASGTTTDQSPGPPATVTTPFVIASTTKTVTATMIMQEVQARNSKLKLTTKLANYYPKLPNAEQITLAMLLGNKSGLPDYDVQKPFSHEWTGQDILDTITKAKDPPGTPDYVNTNWIILGGILEKVPKMPVKTYFHDKIAGPAKMTSEWVNGSER